jgi:dolichol-phosphate mannosyltransferase
LRIGEWSDKIHRNCPHFLLIMADGTGLSGCRPKEVALSPFEVEVLLPVHNEGASIEETLRGMQGELSGWAKVGFIVCEDGSKDNSKEVLRRLAAEMPLRLNLSDARKGYSKAMREGMMMVEADYLLCLDSDGQCDPKDFPKFWNHRESADVMIGWRQKRADTLMRRAFSRFFYLIYQAAFRTPVHDPSCPYVLFRREVAHQLAQDLGEMQEGFWWEFVACAHRRGYRIVEFPVNHQLRSAGKTQVYKWRKMPGIFFRHVAAIGKIRRKTFIGASRAEQAVAGSN